MKDVIGQYFTFCSHIPADLDRSPDICHFLHPSQFMFHCQTLPDIPICQICRYLAVPTRIPDLAISGICISKCIFILTFVWFKWLNANLVPDRCLPRAHYYGTMGSLCTLPGCSLFHIFASFKFSGIAPSFCKPLLLWPKCRVCLKSISHPWHQFINSGVLSLHFEIPSPPPLVLQHVWSC